jgi:NAD-dependent dihydropyrimidine dehydrogenase PreA subunit
MIKEFKSGEISIKIDHDKCTGCGKCVDTCPVNVYELENGKSVANNVSECVECCACIDACPSGAIEHSSC